MAILTKKQAQNALKEAPPEHVFLVCDGSRISSLAGLHQALEQMKGEVYAYHASPQRNDFSTWVKDIFGDEKLAADLRVSRSQAEAARMVARRVEWLRNKR